MAKRYSKHPKGGHMQGGHTGRIRHSDMTSLMDGHGSQDPHADPSHHQMNKAHGTPAGMSPMGDYGDGDEGPTEGLEGCNMTEAD